jgi:RNA polymerase sigma factor (sigma-70 family)
VLPGVSSETLSLSILLAVQAFHKAPPWVSHRAMEERIFDGVVTTHHGEIFRYLRRLSWRHGEADDLSQETFLRAYRAWGGLAADANVRAWLFTIATNVYRNHVRSERRRQAAHATVRSTRRELELDGPEEEAMAVEMKTLTEAAIRRLPLKQRLAFTLRKLHELDYEAIGQSLECSPESARAHVFQALRKIRTTLNGHVQPLTESTR